MNHSGNAGAYNSSKRYTEKRRIIQQNIKQKNYWPEGITHPKKFRKFYVAQDLSYCGFAQNENEIGKRRQEFVKAGNNNQPEPQQQVCEHQQQDEEWRINL